VLRHLGRRARALRLRVLARELQRGVVAWNKNGTLSDAFNLKHDLLKLLLKCRHGRLYWSGCASWKSHAKLKTIC
jgi:hypothetical protein